MAGNESKSERNTRVCAEYLRGDHMDDIAQRHGISRQRVRQIVEQHHRRLGLEPPRRHAKRRMA